MSYVDGFIVPVPRKKLGAYRIAEAEGVAALLAALVLTLFLLADRLGKQAHARRA